MELTLYVEQRKSMQLRTAPELAWIYDKEK